ncbi:hypothetical protein CBS101457_000622 [Exobasidium rhododendri]|nr:hypothetical protein CBS101457_000622 [Exobasidium rhododendri]
MSFRNAIAAIRPHGVRSFSCSSNRLDISRMQLIGRLVADPEQRTTKNGKDYVKYTVATNDPPGPPAEDGTRPNQTSSFHNIFAFGENAVERLSRLQKGTQVFVEADFKVQYNPSESGEPGRADYLIQHRSLNVLLKPKSASAEEE